MSKGFQRRLTQTIPKEWFLKGTDTRVQRVRIGSGGGKFMWAVPDGTEGSFRRVFKVDMEKR